MYDIDGNGTIEKSEMVQIIKVGHAVSVRLSDWSSPRLRSNSFCSQAIYNMVGNDSGTPEETPEDRTEKIFSQMDKNNDGVLNKQEFIDGCLADDFLCQMLTANTAGS